MRQCWVRGLWLFFPISDFTLLVSLKILWLLFLGPWADSSTDSMQQKKWAQPKALFSPFFPSVPFYLMYTLEQNKPCLSGNDCGCGECICALLPSPSVHERRKVQIIFNLVEKVTERKTYLQWKGTQPRCGSAASVSPGRGKSGPPRRPPELPQRRRRAAPGWQSASLQGRDTRRLERSIPTIARFTGRRCWIEPLCWQELIPESEESEAKWTALKTSSTQLTTSPPAVTVITLNVQNVPELHAITSNLNSEFEDKAIKRTASPFEILLKHSYFMYSILNEK